MKCQSRFIVLFILLAATVCLGQVPKTINYQGFLAEANGKAVPNGNYVLTVKLYSVVDGAAPLWTETQTVAIKNGAFNAVLGNTKCLDIPLDKSYWIGHAVGTDPEMTPRIKFAATASNVKAEPDGLALVSGNMLDHSSTGTKKAKLSEKMAASNGFALSGCLIINCSRQLVDGPAILRSLRQN